MTLKERMLTLIDAWQKTLVSIQMALIDVETRVPNYEEKSKKVLIESTKVQEEISAIINEALSHGTHDADEMSLLIQFLSSYKPQIDGMIQNLSEYISNPPQKKEYNINDEDNEGIEIDENTEISKLFNHQQVPLIEAFEEMEKENEEFNQRQQNTSELSKNDEINEPESPLLDCDEQERIEENEDDSPDIDAEQSSASSSNENSAADEWDLLEGSPQDNIRDLLKDL